MSQILADIADKFGNSVPVYNIISDGSEIKFELQERYRPIPGAGRDPVEIMLIRHYDESFDKHAGKFVKADKNSDAYNDMVSYLIKLYLEYSPLKNPKQSNLYRWLEDYGRRYNHPFNDGFVLLYRYAHRNGLDNLRVSLGKDNPHIKNILAILQRIKEKYEG